MNRTELRLALHARRDALAIDAAMNQALAGHLGELLQSLQPDCLGLYWPYRSEFNAASACLADKELDETALALPYSRRQPREMVYRLWDGETPTLTDECGIASIEGAPVVPDVVLAPCLGFSRGGWRIGYGGGYFDRWLASHPHVTAVGVAWSACEVDADRWTPEPHDLPMMLILTEHGVVA